MPRLIYICHRIYAIRPSIDLLIPFVSQAQQGNPRFPPDGGWKITFLPPCYSPWVARYMPTQARWLNPPEPYCRTCYRPSAPRPVTMWSFFENVRADTTVMLPWEQVRPKTEQVSPQIRILSFPRFMCRKIRPDSANRSGSAVLLQNRSRVTHSNANTEKILPQILPHNAAH